MTTFHYSTLVLPGLSSCPHNPSPYPISFLINFISLNPSGVILTIIIILYILVTNFVKQNIKILETVNKQPAMTKKKGGPTHDKKVKKHWDP